MRPVATALIIAVPEAESLVRALRLRYDESARLGVPAHVTVLFPFLPPAEVSSEVLASLDRLFSRQRRFHFRLESVGRFPATCYLEPRPPERFVALTQAVWGAYPGFPPFAGAFESIVPHLTVADGDAADATQAAAELERRLARHGPIHSVCGAVALMENSSGRWRPFHEFRLASESGD